MAILMTVLLIECDFCLWRSSAGAEYNGNIVTSTNTHLCRLNQSFCFIQRAKYIRNMYNTVRSTLYQNYRKQCDSKRFNEIIDTSS